ncbi:hypothetical protein [Lihuaxuella thermophila]|nr:hypothetical protein [Lihuaxuella thermophila]
MSANFSEFQGLDLGIEKTNELVQKLKDTFVDIDQFNKNQRLTESGKTLMWLAFRKEPVVFTYEQLKDYHFFINDNDYLLYLYDERRNKAYQTDILSIYSFLESSYQVNRQLDVYVFDHSFEWVYSITHEDYTVLIVGLPGPRKI